MSPILGDNRYAYLAYSLGARWIKAFEDLPQYWLKNLCVDEKVGLPDQAMHWESMNLRLINSDLNLQDEEWTYHPADWPAPAFAPY